MKQWKILICHVDAALHTINLYKIFKVSMEVRIYIVFWVMRPCSGYQPYGGTYSTSSIRLNAAWSTLSRNKNDTSCEMCKLCKVCQQENEYPWVKIREFNKPANCQVSNATSLLY
jgi:hypothetical protein